MGCNGSKHRVTVPIEAALVQEAHLGRPLHSRRLMEPRATEVELFEPQQPSEVPAEIEAADALTVPRHRRRSFGRSCPAAVFRHLVRGESGDQSLEGESTLIPVALHAQGSPSSRPGTPVKSAAASSSYIDIETSDASSSGPESSRSSHWAQPPAPPPPPREWSLSPEKQAVSYATMEADSAAGCPLPPLPFATPPPSVATVVRAVCRGAVAPMPAPREILRLPLALESAQPMPLAALEAEAKLLSLRVWEVTGVLRPNLNSEEDLHAVDVQLTRCLTFVAEALPAAAQALGIQPKGLVLQALQARAGCGRGSPAPAPRPSRVYAAPLAWQGLERPSAAQLDSILGEAEAQRLANAANELQQLLRVKVEDDGDLALAKKVMEDCRRFLKGLAACAQHRGVTPWDVLQEVLQGRWCLDPRGDRQGGAAAGGA